MSKEIAHSSRKAKAGSQILPDFRDLIECAQHGVLIHENFKPLYVNTAFATMFGFDSVDDVMSLPLLRPLVPTEIWPQIEESYSDLIYEKRAAQVHPVRMIRTDGSEIWVSISERVIDWKGRVAVQWFIYDISQRVAIEQTLAEREQRLQAMLEILPTPVYIERHDDGRILFVNRKTCLLLHQSAGPLLKRKSIDFFQNHEDWSQLRVLLNASPDAREIEMPMKTAENRSFVAEIAAITVDYGNAPAILVALNDISQRKQLEAELFHQASTDLLTGISNRRYFMTQAEADFRRARRYHHKLVVMMLDVDHFKSINDHYGHATGDEVLREIVSTGLKSLRDSDIIGRLGGEEFAVLLHETDIEAAVEVAERLRQSVEKQPIKVGRTILHSSLSIGVAQLGKQDKTIDDLLHRADEAMYKAKHAGRNRVVVAT